MSIAIYTVAFGFGGMGLYALVRPAGIGRLFDVRIESVDGRNETRAVYGGFGIAVAAALLLATRNTQLHDGIVFCVACALAGMVGGRVVSVAIERPGSWPWIFGGVEAVAAVVLLCTVPESVLRGF